MSIRENAIDRLHWKEYKFIGQDNAIFEGSLTQKSEEQIVDQILAYLKAEIEKGGLTDKEIDRAFEDTFEKPVTLDHKPTADEILALKLRSVAEAQLQGILKLLEEK